MPPPTVCLGRRVVVTGMGAVTPLGRTLQSSFDALFLSRSGSAAIQPAEVYESYGIPRVAAAQVKDVNETNAEPGRRALGAQEPRGVAFALTAASEAVTASGGADALRAAYNNGDGIGVAFGTGISGVEELLGAQAALETRGFRRVSPYLVPNSLVNMAAGRISIANGFRGPNHAVSTACATGAHAIGDAFRFIKYGDADAMVCGGSDACIVPVVVAGFARAKALAQGFTEAPETASRPFDEGRCGFVIGEGAAALVLEEREAAIARGAPILAEIVGYGLSGDAFHITAPEETGSGARRCMQAALKEAGLPPSAIGYVNAHATSTPLGDAIEARAIRDVFGEQVPVSSCKGALGHLLGAAGAIEAAITIMSLKNGMLPHTLNLAKPSAGIDIDLIMGAPRQSNGVTHALSNSFGFGGTNAALCISRADI